MAEVRPPEQNSRRKSKLKSVFQLARSPRAAAIMKASFRKAKKAPIVETRNGSLEGFKIWLKSERKPVNVFLGIPYAQPPVGELRFKKPEPLREKWDGIRSAKRYGNRSIQKDFFWDVFTKMRVGKSEDCLHLNVIAPAVPPQSDQFPDGYAVMVYIHGGGFVMDSAAKYHYRNIARSLVRHDVIVVTLQYRLSYLGFFCTGDENASGNYGIWDQIFALRWIQANIRQFGGNPKKVTVFGQSAGAVSADLLSLSPVSRDLLNQVILMGGNAETIWGISKKADLVAYCRKKAVDIGFKPSEKFSKEKTWTREENARMMTFLRRQPAARFQATMIGDRSVLGELRIPITPVFDDELLPASIAELRAQAKPRRVIIGVSQYEGLLFLALGLQKADRKFLNFCENQAFKVLKTQLGQQQEERQQERQLELEYDGEFTMDKFRQLYGITNKTQRDKNLTKRACVDMVSDMVNNFALENYCRKMSASSSTVYRYVFHHYNRSATLALNPLMPFQGATHCTELLYLFDVNIFVVPYRRNALDRKVHDIMTRYWTNFAKFGDPNQSAQATRAERAQCYQQEQNIIDVQSVATNSVDSVIQRGSNVDVNNIVDGTNSIEEIESHPESLGDSGISSQGSSFNSSQSSSFQDGIIDDKKNFLNRKSDDNNSNDETKSASKHSTNAEDDARSDCLESSVQTFANYDERNAEEKQQQEEQRTEGTVSLGDSDNESIGSAFVTEQNASRTAGKCALAAYWPAVGASGTSSCGHMIICALPKFHAQFDEDWKRVRQLAHMADRTTRYDN